MERAPENTNCTEKGEKGKMLKYRKAIGAMMSAQNHVKIYWLCSRYFLFINRCYGGFAPLNPPLGYLTINVQTNKTNAFVAFLFLTFG